MTWRYKVMALWNLATLVTTVVALAISLLLFHEYFSSPKENALPILCVFVLPAILALTASLITLVMFNSQTFFTLVFAGVVLLVCICIYSLIQGSDSLIVPFLLLYLSGALWMARRLIPLTKNGCVTTAAIIRREIAYPGLFRLSFKHRYVYEFTNQNGQKQQGYVNRFLFYARPLQSGALLTLRYLPYRTERAFVLNYTPAPETQASADEGTDHSPYAFWSKESISMRLKKLWNLISLGVAGACLFFPAAITVSQYLEYSSYKKEGIATVGIIKKIYHTNPSHENPDNPFYFMDYSYRAGNQTITVKRYEIGTNTLDSPSYLKLAWEGKEEGDSFSILYNQHNPHGHLIALEKSLEAHLMTALFVSLCILLPFAVMIWFLITYNKLWPLKGTVFALGVYTVIFAYRLLFIDLTRSQQTIYAVSILVCILFTVLLVHILHKRLRNNIYCSATLTECTLELRAAPKWAVYLIHYTLTFKDMQENTQQSVFTVYLLDLPRFSVGESVRIGYNRNKLSQIYSVAAL